MRGKGIRSIPWVLVGALTIIPLAACGGTGEESPPVQEGQTPSSVLSDEAQQLVNQGNAAQREGRYAEALGYFGQALEIHPDHPVPQFGSLMAAQAVGDTALVRTMRGKLAESGPELLDMLGPGGAMGGEMPGAAHMPPGALPQGHPQISPQGDDTVPPRPGANG